jgi:hypothetical protein
VSRFSRAAGKVGGGPLAIPLTLVFIAMFAVAIIISYGDYTSSRLGYMMLPTRKTSAAVIWAVALVPQLGQIGFSYAWGRDWRTNRQLAFISLFTAVSLFLVDVGTDVYFKAAGQGTEAWLVAIPESILLFTLGSEIMLVVSFGMLVQLLPEFVAQAQQLAERLSKALDKLDSDGMGLEEDW